MSLTDIPTDTFNQILADFCAEGWEIVSEYNGIDAWIDYGNVLLRKDDINLSFEWDNWYEGIIEGPEDLLQAVRIKYALPDRPLSS